MSAEAERPHARPHHPLLGDQQRDLLGSPVSGVKGGYFTAKSVTIPFGVSTFTDELYRVPRSLAEQAYPHLIYYNEHDRGSHSAAGEQPQLLSEDVRATFRSLRTNGGSS